VNNNNLGKAGGSGGQGLSQAEMNYRNTLNNTEKRLKSLREYQSNMDRLRMEANDTPISDASGPTSLRLNNNNNNNNNSSSLNCLGSGASAKGKKSILVRKVDKGMVKEKKSVSFAEA